MTYRHDNLPAKLRTVLERFVTLCQKDDRVMAAFLGGSYARGNADSYSDLDLFLITSDKEYDGFLANKADFVRQLGEPLFLEDFGSPPIIFFTFADNAEFELHIGREGRFLQLYQGPYRVLIDKNGILQDAVLPQRSADPAKQVEKLRQQVDWFWHDLSHFIKAMGRKELWFAYGQLEVLRGICINLARLRYNFSDPEVGEDPYFKVEYDLPPSELLPLEETCCTLNYEAIVQAATIIFQYYRDLAPLLAGMHGIPYRAGLEKTMLRELANLRKMKA